MAAVSLHNAYELVPSNGAHVMGGEDSILMGIKVYSFLWADRELCQGTWLSKRKILLFLAPLTGGFVQCQLTQCG